MVCNLAHEQKIRRIPNHLELTLQALWHNAAQGGGGGGEAQGLGAGGDVY